MQEDPLWPSSWSALFDLLLIAGLVVYAVSAIVFFWRQPYLLALLLLPAPLVLAARLGPSGLATAATGGVIGPLTEAACVAGGLWSYADTGGLFLIPPWLPVGWGCFPTALCLIARSLQEEVVMPGRNALAFCLAGIVLEIAFFLTLSQSLPLILAAFLLLAAAIILAVPRAARTTSLVLMAAGAVLGPLFEALPVAEGAWSYARPDIMGIPLWLPLAYALFAVLVSFAGKSVADHLNFKRNA
ncbi:MAG: hypothetical protein MUE87_02065 [Methanothrix sp.]|jgi:uncharacterized membrane protein YoaT (DUF817 family)|nr:hypothetical protein [Methanothrix sp.]